MIPYVDSRLDGRISPIQEWIEQAYGHTYYSYHGFGTLVYAHDFILSSTHPVVHFVTHIYLMVNISLFWMVTKHKGKNLNFVKMLRWLHWIFHFT